MPNFTKKIITQFQKNAWEEGQTERGEDGRADRLYLIAPFLLPTGIQKELQESRINGKSNESIEMLEKVNNDTTGDDVAKNSIIRASY